MLFRLYGDFPKGCGGGKRNFCLRNQAWVQIPQSPSHSVRLEFEMALTSIISIIVNYGNVFRLMFMGFARFIPVKISLHIAVEPDG